MIKIEISVQGLNFYWSEKGYKDFDGTPIECCWDDVDYSVHLPDGVKEGGTVAETCKYFQYEIESLNGSYGKALEERCPGLVEEELKETAYGLTMEELTKISEIKWGFYYDEPDDPNKYEIEDMINLPRNKKGVLPSLISACLPTDKLTKKNLEEFITEYARKFLGVVDDIEVVWSDTPTDGTLEREHQEYIRQCKAWNEMRKKGEKPKIHLLPQVLASFVGEKVVKSYIERGMKTAEFLSDTDEYLIHFEDGSTEIFNKDLSSDHFSEPDTDFLT